MICTAPNLKSCPFLSRSTVRRSVMASALTLALVGSAGFAFAAEPSSDATPSPLDISIIQGLSTSDHMKSGATEPAAPTTQPAPAAAAPAASSATSATPKPASSANAAADAAQAQVVAVEKPAAGSAAESVEKQLSAFDMGAIRALVSPPAAADAAPAAAPMQAAKAPEAMDAPAQPAPAAEPKPAAKPPLPDSQMELIQKTFTIESAG